MYLLDWAEYRVIVIDFDMNFIKYFSLKNGENKIAYPYGLCFKNGFLYISDSIKRHIQVFNQNLEFSQSLKLKYQPMQLQASNSILAVKSDDGIYFHDINSLNIISLYNLSFEINLSEIDSMFYGFYHHTKEFYYFDQNWNFIEKINLNENDEVGVYDEKLVVFNKTLLMYSQTGKKIIKFL